ncbi:uncharacterized protein BCR38DRAFT_204138 [Pseudomassariella vexata]|uniref:Uncharacterized protein n=1 Tax=Pseudomassariella vexata TaxID=1141098 RepID=A0A1Y2DY38_9PEZI|nr:uncharacterized protein BCR38DRAFT_204138 [Pseudomassariella vexata]ORY64014.1 hypothetical protein BCR38DRAFT_204138 [Pseudomassariella vexata]
MPSYTCRAFISQYSHPAGSFSNEALETWPHLFCAYRNIQIVRTMGGRFWQDTRIPTFLASHWTRPISNSSRSTELHAAAFELLTTTLREILVSQPFPSSQAIRSHNTPPPPKGQSAIGYYVHGAEHITAATPDVALVLSGLPPSSCCRWLRLATAIRETRLRPSGCSRCTRPNSVDGRRQRRV